MVIINLLKQTSASVGFNAIKMDNPANRNKERYSLERVVVKTLFVAEE